jgi:hypothetical protein
VNPDAGPAAGRDVEENDVQLPRPHPADRALVRGQIIAVALLAAGYAAPWVLLSREWDAPVWWAAGGALGAAIVATGIALLARTHGEQRARREMKAHRGREAAARGALADPGAVEAKRVDQVLAGGPGAPAGSAEDAIVAVLDTVGPGGLPRAAIADRLEERSVFVRPEDLSVLLGRLVAAGAISLTDDGWYVSEAERARIQVAVDQATGVARVDLRGRGRGPARPGRRVMSAADRAAWAMLTRPDRDGEPDQVDQSPAAAADTPADLLPPPMDPEEVNRLWDAPLDGSPAAAPADEPAGSALADLVVDAVLATREDGIAKRALLERLAAQGQPVDAVALDTVLAELVAAGRLVQATSWGRYRHPRYVQG